MTAARTVHVTGADDRIAALRADVAALAEADPVFGRAALVAGDFPLVLRPATFGTLLYLILEQQVSIAAARAMYDRLCGILGTVNPSRFLDLDDDVLRSCGFSRQKTGYARGLARTIAAGDLDLADLDRLDDDAAMAVLCRLKGIGPWTAECYLLWALGRRDILPAGDLALQIGWQWLAELDARPAPKALRTMGDAWRPRRTAATLLIWHYYLGTIAARRAAARSGT